MLWAAFSLKAIYNSVSLSLVLSLSLYCWFNPFICCYRGTILDSIRGEASPLPTESSLVMLISRGRTWLVPLGIVEVGLLQLKALSILLEKPQLPIPWVQTKQWSQTKSQLNWLCDLSWMVVWLSWLIQSKAVILGVLHCLYVLECECRLWWTWGNRTGLQKVLSCQTAEP